MFRGCLFPGRQYNRAVISPDEKHVMDVLQKANIVSEKIPETTHRTPDLVAHDDEHSYLLEVKSRTDDTELTSKLRKRGSVRRTTPIAWTNTAAGILQDAVKQLRAANTTDELQLVWICIRSRLGRETALAEQLRHTLYGISRVHGTGRACTTPPCFFFHDSVFFRCRELVGVVLDIGRGGMLCVNPYAERVTDLRKSRLGVFLRRNTFDPFEPEHESSYLIADCNIDRRRSDLVLQYVSAKYGIENAIHFNLDEHFAAATVNPNEDLDESDDVLILDE